MDLEKRTEIKRVLLIVEHAITGHRELDEHVLVACGGKIHAGGQWSIGDDIRLHPPLCRFTQSVDAALSLREEVLPEWHFKILMCDATLWASADSVLQDRLPSLNVTADAMTTPLAICAAILKALLALAEARPKQAAI